MEEFPRVSSSQLEGIPIGRKKRTRKVKRRGRKNIVCKSMTNSVLLHSNVRGLKSKLQSLNHVANNVAFADCISLNEHGIRGKNKVKIENYYSFSKNRLNKRMGGVSLSIPEDKLSLS